LNGDLSSLYPSKIPELYLHQAFNTQLLDILAHQVSSLIKSCIDIALRKIKDMNLPKNSSTQITNLLLNPSGDIRENIIKSKLEGKYWTSSRHLALVSNEHMSFNEWEKRYKKKIIPEKDKNRNKGKKILIDKLLLNLPETLIENFQLYTKAIPKLNYYKALDAQIQVRQAYLLKKFLEYFKKDKKFPHDYIFNPKIAKNVIKMLRCFYE